MERKYELVEVYTNLPFEHGDLKASIEKTAENMRGKEEEFRQQGWKVVGKDPVAFINHGLGQIVITHVQFVLEKISTG